MVLPSVACQNDLSMGTLIVGRWGCSRSSRAFSVATSMPVLRESLPLSDCNSRGWHCSTLVIVREAAFIHVAALSVRRDPARIRGRAAISWWAVLYSSTRSPWRAKPSVLLRGNGDYFLLCVRRFYAGSVSYWQER